MNNKALTLAINYPEETGFTKTDISIHNEKCDLASRYLSEENNIKRLFVTDSTIANLESVKSFLSEIDSNKTENDFYIILGAGEKYKTIENVLAIVQKALENNFNRNSLFIGIGGGVICDMTAFAASIFKRGIKVDFVPTTLLADVDASLGGKTGCDFCSYKNMIGTFWPAGNITIYPEFIKSLPENEFFSGLAESIKTAALFSKDLTQFIIENKDKIIARDSDVMTKIIEECAKQKAHTVEIDFREKNIRAFLNLGHTFGHALESVAGLGTVTHGEAVAWGMERANVLGEMLGITSKETHEKIKLILESFGYDTKPLPDALEGVENAKNKLLNAMHKDKKNNSSVIKIIYLKEIASPVVLDTNDSDILKVF